MESDGNQIGKLVNWIWVITCPRCTIG